VSIAKALAGARNAAILDEPSAILTDSGIDVLFGVIRRLTDPGRRRLHLAPPRRAVPIADAVTVTRDWRHRRYLPLAGRGPGDRRADGRRHPERGPAGAQREDAPPRLELESRRPASSTTSTRGAAR